jgi:hypothetical protein
VEIHLRRKDFEGIVNLGSELKHWSDEGLPVSLLRLSFPSRNHQLCRPPRGIALRLRGADAGDAIPQHRHFGPFPVHDKSDIEVSLAALVMILDKDAQCSQAPNEVCFNRPLVKMWP